MKSFQESEDPKEAHERRETYLREEILKLETSLEIASYWRDTKERGPAVVALHRYAMGSDLQDSSIMSPSWLGFSFGAVLEDLEGTREIEPKELKRSLQHIASVRERLWTELQEPEAFLETSENLHKHLDFLSKRLLSDIVDRDGRRLVHSIESLTGNFGKIVGELMTIGIALHTCWRRDIPNVPPPEDIHETWQTLADIYIRLHSQPELPLITDSKDPAWKNLQVIVGRMRVLLDRASTLLAEYATKKKRADRKRT